AGRQPRAAPADRVGREAGEDHPGEGDARSGRRRPADPPRPRGRHRRQGHPRLGADAAGRRGKDRGRPVGRDSHEGGGLTAVLRGRRDMSRWSAVLVGFAAAFAALVAAEPADRLPRDDLLVYRGDDGKPRKVTTIEDWGKRRAEIVRGMESVMGKLPGPEKR